jgi:hypothetical protein
VGEQDSSSAGVSRVGNIVVTLQPDPSGDRWQCRVAVDVAGQRSGHTVTVTRRDLERWGRGSHSKDIVDLVVRSFEFLLEREPASSILSSFELSVIPHYFPEYNQVFNNA